jgi:hypothetical protein
MIFTPSTGEQIMQEFVISSSVGNESKENKLTLALQKLQSPEMSSISIVDTFEVDGELRRILVLGIEQDILLLRDSFPELIVEPNSQINLF